MAETQTRPQTLEGHSYRLEVEHGHLFVTINHIDGKPFEVFAWLGKAGSGTSGMTEAISRLASLHLRRGTSVNEVINQLDEIGEMQPWPNAWLGKDVVVRGIADGIAKCLAYFQKHHVGEDLDDTAST